MAPNILTYGYRAVELQVTMKLCHIVPQKLRGRKEGVMICYTKKFSTFAISLSHCSGWHTHPRFPYKVVTIFSRKEE